MRKNEFFGNQIPPQCDYCAHAANASNGISCLLGQAISESGVCRHFRYDPLRRVPMVQPPVPKPDSEEFKL